MNGNVSIKKVKPLFVIENQSISREGQIDRLEKVKSRLSKDGILNMSAAEIGNRKMDSLNFTRHTLELKFQFCR